ncbi:Cytochrome P450(MEG) [Paenibacillus allorhizosphaerae]|uniref:Cytochrome P450(MEG) n=2 Tax=Paenibacillus allorhizosphaerae TaxID=2849866 RepID=A0ABM8VD04_9BACL|nr:cytochrome P450 [Paenibacillus allorhizosphaerae]CAG7625940.1 Cytochrome P450(MEG) [Paenibacillus allorhizosphaerae]
MNQNILLNEISKLKSKQSQWEPFAWYKEMRENSPVFYDAEQDVWNVFLYEHAKRVLFDHELFSNKKERSLIPTPSKSFDNRSNVNMVDPPEHRKRRALQSQAFTPRSLKEWEPRIQAIVDELIADMEGESTLDIMEKLAIPLPVTVIAELLGVPSKDRRLIKSWSDILFLPYNKEAFVDIDQQKRQAMKEFRDYLFPIVQEKRKHPVDDIISDLTKAELEGEQLTDEEVVMSAIGLLGAGNETTTKLISNVFYCILFDKPGIYQELRSDVSLVPNMIEEVLRFRFTAHMDRRVAQDTNVFGHEMKEGQVIVAWIGSANRDESEFAHAEEFDIHRPNIQHHLSFGSGPHFCLGAPLARMEARIALTAFVKRFADIRPVAGFEVTEHLADSVLGQSLENLPIMVDHNK